MMHFARLGILQNERTLRTEFRRTLTKKERGWFRRKLGKSFGSDETGGGPPYTHVVQIGDAVLRRRCEEVGVDEVRGPHVQAVVRSMMDTINRYDALGLSAPQIGVPLKIIAIQTTNSQLRLYSEETIAKRKLTEFPLKVFINPKLKITDYAQIADDEGCCSVHGFHARVTRYNGVHVSGLDPEGNAHEWEASGWPARILQHEMDHLEGKLFVDIMEKESLTFSYWPIVNSREGQFSLSYRGVKDGPRSWLVPYWLYKGKY